MRYFCEVLEAYLGRETSLAARVGVDACPDQTLAGDPVIELRLGERRFVGRERQGVAVARAEQESRAEEADEVVLLRERQEASVEFFGE